MFFSFSILSKFSFLTSLFLTSLVSPALSDEVSLSKAFDLASLSETDASYEISFHLDGCVFQETLVNLNYCATSGAGKGDREILTQVDLREVEGIAVRKGTHGIVFMFSLEYDRPGRIWIQNDIAANGQDGSFERFQVQLEKALDSVNWKSRKTYSKCEGGIYVQRKLPTLAITTERKPQGWERLIEVARMCRGMRPMAFSDGTQ